MLNWKGRIEPGSPKTCSPVARVLTLEYKWMYDVHRIRKALENRTNMEDDRVAILESQLAQAKLIAEEADKKYEEVRKSAAQTPDWCSFSTPTPPGQRFCSPDKTFGHKQVQRKQIFESLINYCSLNCDLFDMVAGVLALGLTSLNVSTVCARSLRTGAWQMKSAWTPWRTSWRRRASWPRRPTRNTMRWWLRRPNQTDSDPLFWTNCCLTIPIENPYQSVCALGRKRERCDLFRACHDWLQHLT